MIINGYQGNIIITMTTRPSALGMSDPIRGPLIHNFVYETYHDQVNYENSVYFKKFENGEGTGGIYLEKKNTFFGRRKRE